MNESVWSKNLSIPPRPPLCGDMTADAAIIGGGLAGVLIAHELQSAGLHTVVLEASRLGSGQTKNTTAKITSQHNLIYHRLTEQFGEEYAGQYAHANQAAIERYRKLIQEESIDCDFMDCPAYLYATVDGNPLEQEYAAVKRLGISAVLVKDTELPFPVVNALRFDHQGRFHPLKFLKHVAADLEVYEQTPVINVEGERVLTKKGTVTAKNVIFACHYPFLNMPGFYFMRMHQERSYVIALENAAKPTGMYLGIDGGALSFRTCGELLLLGGGSHRTGENGDGGQYSKLREAAALYWKNSKETANWSAQDCMTLDGVPYIGQFAQFPSHWYVATGFQKWGMTSSMVSAMRISDLILQRKNKWEVFTPLRFTPSASAKTLYEETAHALKGISKKLFVPPKADADALPAGHGGVVELEGEKVGVYKDKQGEIFAVSLRCPHLGCELAWNPEEKSWDCPCHGSRFDFRGKRIDNPAQTNLDHT